MSDGPDIKQIRRIEQRERRHRAILDAAQGVVEREGLDGLTMPGLARELGVAVGGLYRTFPSKERIVVELQARAVDRLWRRLGHRWRVLREPLADDATRALATLVVSLDGTLQLAEVDPTHHALLARLWAQPPADEHAAWLVDRAQPFLEAILARYSAAVEAEVIADADPLPTLAWWGASLFAAQALPPVVRLEPDAIVDGILRSAGADGPALEQARRLVARAGPASPR